MAISTHAELVAAVARYLDRSDLSVTEIPEAIQLVDAKLDRELRKNTTREPFTINALVKALPTGASEVRYLKINEPSGTVNRILEQVSFAALADSSSKFTSSGRPTKYAVMDGNIIFNRTPDTSYTAEIAYFDTHTSAATDASLIAAEPDLYLEGTLTQMFTFLQHDERVAEHKANFEAIIASVNKKRERVEFGAAPQPIRLPVVFGERG